MPTPPKTRRKLNPVARAEVGQIRECDTCGETKEVSHKTFSLSKKGRRGWATTCRVCQGLASTEVHGAYAEERQSGEFVPPAGDDIDDLINEMYLLHETRRNPGRLDEIANDLGNRVKKLAETDRNASLRLFIKIVKPLIAGWRTPGRIHDDIIDGLLSQGRRRLIIATRYSAKSTLTSIYVAWRIFQEPLIKVMVVSRGSRLAQRMLRTVRRVFIQNCPVLLHLMPTEDCLDNAEQFQTPQALKVTTGGATLSCFGITSDLPGYRSDLTIGDDVEGPSDDTPEKVLELEEKLNELHMINPVGEKIMLGTYQSEFSVYARLADKVDADEQPVWELHRACMFEEDDVGIHSRWPEMFSDKDALDWRRSVTTRAWRLHALLIADPSILNEKPLKISDLILYEHNARAGKFPMTVNRSTRKAADVPTWGAPKGDVWYYGDPAGNAENFAEIVAAIDPASGLAGRDAIGVAVLGVTLGGQAVILHLEGVRGPTKAANMRRCALILKEFGVRCLVIEETKEGFFGETLENELIIVEHPLSVEKVTTGGQQKGRRIIETLAPPMGDGRLIMTEAVARSDHGGEFVTQMTRISYDGRTGKAKDHDDIVDALAHAVAKVKGSLISDRAELAASYSQAMAERLRGIPTVRGGLGGGSDFHDTLHGIVNRPTHATRGGEQSSLGELMVEEDEVLIALEERRQRFMDVLREDSQLGRAPDPHMLNRIKALNKQIEELKEVRVL